MGPRTAPLPGASTNHKGLDIKVPVGTTVNATGGGRVVWAGWQDNNNHKAGFGQYVKIDHGNGTFSYVGHLSRVDVKPGDIVQPGQQVGLSGNTGNSSGPHVHYQVNKDGKAIPPPR